MPDSLPNDSPVLWRINGWGRQLVGPNRPYWWENRERIPDGQVYAQLTLEGRILHRDAQGEERWCEPGSLVLFKHGEPTSYGRPPGDRTPYRCHWIALLGAGLYEHWQWLQERCGSVHPLGDDQRIPQALERLIDLADERSQATVLARAAGTHNFVNQLFAVLEERRSAGTRSPLDRALEELLAQPMGGGTLKELARRHGVSREHLARAAHERLGRPPAAWLAGVRLTQALQLLKETALPIAEVARQSGFPSAHTLARQVRRSTGKSPAQIRRGT
jgi:AraC-like DNA-binding protein